MRIFLLFLPRVAILGAVGGATYVISSAGDHHRYLMYGVNVFLPAAVLLACIAGLNAASFSKLRAEATRRTPKWELAVKQCLGPALLQVFEACHQMTSGKPCCTIAEAQLGLRVYLVGRPMTSAFARRLSLATSFDFTNPAVERWGTGEWVIGRAFTSNSQKGWRRSVDWPGLGASFSQSDWDNAATDKMDVSYQRALKLGMFNAIIAIPIRRNQGRRTVTVGVLALLINDECYPCIDGRLVGTLDLYAATIGKLKADGSA